MLSSIFILLTLLVLVLFYLGTGRTKRVLYAGLLWIALIGLLALFDFFKNTTTTPPRFIIIFGGVLILAFYFLKTVRTIRPTYLHAIHLVRIPVELCLYQLFLQQLIPEIMTFKGWNFDLFFGVSALLILLYSYMRKKPFPALFLIIWNGIGILFLAFIVVIAVLSAPLPFQQLAFDQPNIAVLQFPFIFLPGYIVPVVLLAHILVLKHSKITSAKKNQSVYPKN